MVDRKNLLIAVAAVLLAALAGGWFYARHVASVAARDKVDGFLIRHDLGDRVSYGDVSASPFGSVVLSGVVIRLSPSNFISVASVEVSHVEMKSDEIRSIDIRATGAVLPLLSIVRENRNRNEMVRDLVAMGYTKIKGTIGFSIHYDDVRGTLSVQSTGDVVDAGSWDAKVSFAGIDRGAVSAVYGLADNASNAQNGLALLAMAGQGLRGLASISVTDLELSLDDTELHGRLVQVTNKDLPSEEGVEAPRDTKDPEMKLIMAGMTPSEAQASVEAAARWLEKGGKLKMASNIVEPLALFRGGNILVPAFADADEFVAAARIHVSN